MINFEHESDKISTDDCRYKPQNEKIKKNINKNEIMKGDISQKEKKSNGRRYIKNKTEKNNHIRLREKNNKKINIKAENQKIFNNKRIIKYSNINKNKNENILKEKLVSNIEIFCK